MAWHLWGIIVKTVKQANLMTRSILFILLALAASFSASSAQRLEAVASTEAENVVTLEAQPLESGSTWLMHTNSRTYKYASWPIDDVREFVALYECYEDTVLGFWPLSISCFAEVVAWVNEGKLLARQSKESNALENEQMRQQSRQDSLEHQMRKIWDKSDLSQKHSEEREQQRVYRARLDNNFGDFDTLVAGGGSIFFEGNFYKLNGIAELTTKIAPIMERDNNARLGERRMDAFKEAVPILFVVIFAGAVLYALLKDYKIAVSSIKAKFIRLKLASEKRTIRKAVMDETIREVTRRSIDDADDNAKRILKDELVKAVESGNHDLAKALADAIKRK